MRSNTSRKSSRRNGGQDQYAFHNELPPDKSAQQPPSFTGKNAIGNHETAERIWSAMTVLQGYEMEKNVGHASWQNMIYERFKEISFKIGSYAALWMLNVLAPYGINVLFRVTRVPSS